MYIDVSVDGGKYRYTRDDHGRTVVYRNGQEWFTSGMEFNNMMFHFALELQEARKQLEALQKLADEVRGC